MGVAGIFKKIKNAVKTVTNKVKKTAKTVVNKVKEGVKTVGKKLVNTGAKVVKAWADVNEGLAKGVNTALKIASPIVGKGILGKVFTKAGQAASKLYSNIYDGIGDAAEKVIEKTSNKSKSTTSGTTSGTTITSNRLHGLTRLPNGQKTDWQTARQYNSNQSQQQSKPMQSQPDVVINNYYNQGPRRDYVQQRHPSNPHYNVRDIGPRRPSQPPIMNPQQPIDIQRRNYQTRNYASQQQNNSNAAVSW